MTFKTVQEREREAYITTGHLHISDLMCQVLDAEAAEAEMEEERDSERKDSASELTDAENRIAHLEEEVETLEALIRELRDAQ